MVLACKDPILERNPGFREMSGRFSFSSVNNQSLTFIWDGAAVSSDGQLILIEEELCTPVDIHIQGHVSRAAMMLASGIRIRKIVWVTLSSQFSNLFRIVETWRSVLMDRQGISTPPCDYLDQDGSLLAVSD